MSGETVFSTAFLRMVLFRASQGGELGIVKHVPFNQAVETFQRAFWIQIS